MTLLKPKASKHHNKGFSPYCGASLYSQTASATLNTAIPTTIKTATLQKLSINLIPVPPHIIGIVKKNF